ncbi:hypothetical protein ACFY7Z_04260 [Streptomyces sp. NPDC012623]|uniref:hypothetical protein n=1 Tax=Streptomyces sp. NPDC012623 TaxID=3364841 RepID=UPI0036AA7A95
MRVRVPVPVPVPVPVAFAVPVAVPVASRKESADRWGVDPRTVGKTVFAEIGLTPRAR